jgi:hypothetical protein
MPMKLSASSAKVEGVGEKVSPSTAAGAVASGAGRAAGTLASDAATAACWVGAPGISVSAIATRRDANFMGRNLGAGTRFVAPHPGGRTTPN